MVVCSSLCLSSVVGQNSKDAIIVKFPYHSGRITVAGLERFPFRCSKINLGESFFLFGLLFAKVAYYTVCTLSRLEPEKLASARK